jgi:hypothetical protein
VIWSAARYVHSANDWESVLKPVVIRYKGKVSRTYFRGAAAFADPDIYEYLEGEGIRYAIRSPANAARLQLHALAYNLGSFLRTVATPEPIKEWSLTTLTETLIKTGAKVVCHARYVAFQMAEVAVPRNLFADILRMIAELRLVPVTSSA